MRTRRRFTAEFKAKIALEALQGTTRFPNWPPSTSCIQFDHAMEATGYREVGQVFDDKTPAFDEIVEERPPSRFALPLPSVGLQIGLPTF